MIRFVVAALVIGVVVALVSGVVGSPVAGLVLLVAPLVFLVKVALLVLLLGAFGRGCWRRSQASDDGRRADGGWGRRSDSSQQRTGKSPEQSFEEWHRMAHAKEEVDSWAPPFPDTGENV